MKEQVGASECKQQSQGFLQNSDHKGFQGESQMQLNDVCEYLFDI